MGSKKKADSKPVLKSVPTDIDEEFDDVELEEEVDHGEEPLEEGDPDSFTNEMDDDGPEPEEEPPAPKKKPAAKTKPKAAEKKAPAKKKVTGNKIEVDKYEYALGDETLVFTKRRALALSLYIQSGGKIEPADVAKEMENQYGEPKKGTHLAAARRIRGQYLKLVEAGVIK